MSSFTSNLEVSPQSDGSTWKLVRPFSYHIGSRYSNRIIKVPRGFETDFASIPKFMLAFIPFWAKYQKAAIIHDWLYHQHKVMEMPITRKDADQIFHEGMVIIYRNKGFLGKLATLLEYRAVRCFGWLSWKKRNAR